MKRNDAMNFLDEDWDIIVIGGGITGAGVFSEAANLGFKTLLLEKQDFSSGTSSRSGKLVHGGLRYLKQGQIMTTWHSVREREKLLKKFPNLIEPINFLFPAYKKELLPYIMKLGLIFYDMMACKRSHEKYNAIPFTMQVPGLNTQGLKGGLSFSDAITDDARLVLRVLKSGQMSRGILLNYFEVIDLVRDSLGKVIGVVANDRLTNRVYDLHAKVVINATGIFSDEIRLKLNKPLSLRKLRGSHIIFPQWRFPVYQAISFNHPRDKRPLYVLPWQGTTLIGTTDLEHYHQLEEEPKISQTESSYLFEALHHYFPTLELTKLDALSTFSGIRPVLNTGKKNPSKEARDFIVLDDDGLITVTGGKLTTFRLLAREALKSARKYLHSSLNDKRTIYNLSHFSNQPLSSNKVEKRLFTIFGEEALMLLTNEELLSKGFIDSTDVMWAELIWSARNEQVIHLEDLMLRRTRLGLTLPDGGSALFDTIEKLIAPELGYDKTAFEQEKKAYMELWRKAYSPYIL